MRKPKELSIWKTIAAVGRLNNSLPHFPNGRESDKFTPGEILKILEWSIPEVWRTKFDLDGYVSAEFTKDRLMRECEAVKQNEPTISGKTVTRKKSHAELNIGVRPRKTTLLPLSFIVPNMDKVPHIPRISVTL
jgi:hypothetical protein